MNFNARVTKVGLAAGGLVAGVVLASTMGANAASPSPTPTTGSATTTAADPHPGDNGADGVPEAQEHHDGGHGGGRGLDLTGTVTAVGSSSVTIQTSTGAVTYAVTSGSDIDKNGEAKLSDLAAGDAVTFSVDETNAKAIDKLHAGDEAKNAPIRSSDTTAPSGSAPAA